jgi:uncharacterized protein YndB with AHSA1/START domain
MSAMIDLHFECDIKASAERVFGLLADLRDYDRWLPASSAFKGTHRISDGAIGVGTTYVEPGPFGVRQGQVTEFSPPTRLSFEQPMTLKLKAFGVIGIQLFHTLTQGAGSVHVHRQLRLEPRGLVRWTMSVIVPAFRAENERMMKALKAYAEGDRP